MLKKLFTKATMVRTLSGILLVLLAFAALVSGGSVLFFTMLAISLVGLFELYRVVKVEKNLLGFTGLCAAAIYYVLLYTKNDAWLMVLFIGFLMTLMAVYVFAFPAYTTEQVFLCFFGLFYVAVMMSYVYQIRLLEEGMYLVWMVFISSWICDTCAYLSGVTMGKHKLAPKLSPNKSVEGSVGGIAGAVFIGALYGYALKNQIVVSFGNPVIGCAAVCGLGAVVSQIGDLAASGIKRNHKVKDYGKLIPGHGGILDRFDSVIFVAPAIYFLCMMIG